MCLILFSLNNHVKFKLILAANRDEFYDRATLSADFWENNKSILGGRDIKSGGTWLGINTNGKFIAITNYRDPKTERKNALSRGDISKSFLEGDLGVDQFIAQLSKNNNKYSGYNLLLSDNGMESFYHYSNITNNLERISIGYHGLSNHLLDTAWPKVESAKNRLKQIVDSRDFLVDDLIEMLADEEKPPESSLPNTGISLELEKKLSPVFISMKEYGTRCSTVILIGKDNTAYFLEVSFGSKKDITAKKQFNFELKY